MWRIRALVNTEVTIEPLMIENEFFIYKIFKIDKSNTQNYQNIPNNIRYIDITYKSSENDINEAFALLYDELNKFLDRISYISYGYAILENIISVAPHEISMGDEFEIALPQFSTRRKTLSLISDDLVFENNLTQEQERWLRLLRNGLSTSSEEEKYLSYYSLLEEIARLESQDSIFNECPECHHRVDTGRKATNNFIKVILNSHGLSNKQANKASELRNKIAHGGAVKNKSYYDDLREIGSYLEESCLLEIENRIEKTIKNRLNNHIVSLPIVKHKCICHGIRNIQLIESNLAIPSRFVKLQYQNESLFQNQSTEIGLPLDKNGQPLIDPFSWPDIIYSDEDLQNENPQRKKKKRKSTKSRKSAASRKGKPKRNKKR